MGWLAVVVLLLKLEARVALKSRLTRVDVWRSVAATNVGRRVVVPLIEPVLLENGRNSSSSSNVVSDYVLPYLSAWTSAIMEKWHVCGRWRSCTWG